MFKKKFKKSIIVFGLIAPFSTPAQAQVSDNAPVIHPDQRCGSEPLINPPDKNYRYLFSKDCRTVYVLPPGEVQPKIKSRALPSINSCSDMNEEYSLITGTVKRIAELTAQVSALEESLSDELPEGKYKKIQLQIDAKNKMIADRRAEMNLNIENFNKSWGKIPAAEFSVTFDSQITQPDLNLLRSLNLANLYKTVRREKDGVIEEILEATSLREAPISSSVYSFVLYSSNDNPGGSILKTNIPALAHLKQEGGNTAIAHVREGGILTGDIQLSLFGVCEGLKKSDGTYGTSLSETNPLFTVNRTFSVQQQFFEGYHATLKVDKIVDQIVQETITHTNQGFQKSGAFLGYISGDISKVIDFNWTNNYQTNDSASFEKVLEIKKEVAAYLIDDYFDQLTKAGIIKISTPTSLEPARGGEVAETRLGHRCWTENRGGIGGLFGSRRQVCGDFTYTVNVWRDGITEEEIRKTFDFKTEVSDSMTIEKMTPFYFTTTFGK